MKLSIFPDVKPLPKKSEKGIEASKTGVVRDKKTGEIIKEYLPEIVEIVTEDDLIRYVTSYAWSPSIFNGPRLQENFLQADFIALDIDSGLSLEEAEKRCLELNLTVLGAPSTSHKPEAPRFRLIFPLIRTIKTKEEFDATVHKLAESFPECDNKCLENARFYFAQTMEDGYWLEGDFLKVETPKSVTKKTNRYTDSGVQVKVDMSIQEIVTELYGETRTTIPESVHHFLSNARTGLPGDWTTSLNSFVYTLCLQGIDEDTIWDLVEHVSPEKLDKRDIGTIERALKDGIRDGNLGKT